MQTTIVLVQSAVAGPARWNAVVGPLQADCHRVVAAELPGAWHAVAVSRTKRTALDAVAPVHADAHVPAL